MPEETLCPHGWEYISYCEVCLSEISGFNVQIQILEDPEVAQ